MLHPLYAGRILKATKRNAVLHAPHIDTTTSLINVIYNHPHSLELILADQIKSIIRSKGRRLSDDDRGTILCPTAKIIAIAIMVWQHASFHFYNCRNSRHEGSNGKGHKQANTHTEGFRRVPMHEFDHNLRESGVVVSLLAEK